MYAMLATVARRLQAHQSHVSAYSRWLLGLLVLQSSSSFVLDRYEGLLREHIFVTLFLTMLVGAGGNAGNQSAIKVIRGLATGVLEPTFDCLQRSLRQQVSRL
jgi:Mg/Co/Ni transporter MgtE